MTTTSNDLKMISPTLPFPPVSWWRQARRTPHIVFDLAEHYQKMSYRNRYYLAAPAGKMLMSLPLENGRNQRIPVSMVKLSDRADWQENHWKTICSLYGRAPFFEHFSHLLQPLFTQRYASLHEFNIAGIQLVQKLLQLPLSFSETREFLRQYDETIPDLRQSLSPQQETAIPEYYQVFADRTGFLHDCSILDLLFCEGPYAAVLLKAD